MIGCTIMVYHSRVAGASARSSSLSGTGMSYSTAQTAYGRFLRCCFDSEESFYGPDGISPGWCSGGQRPLIAGCISLQRLGEQYQSLEHCGRKNS